VENEHQYRNYAAPARDSVSAFYEANHRQQSLDFVRGKRAQYLGLNHRTMAPWDALLWMDTLVDDSDPDTNLSQLQHALQTAEAIRKDGHPEWFIVTGLMHDLGKALCLFGEPQWAVVGDTFPVGCAWSPTNVYPEYFASNPDLARPELQTENGIYEPGCGLDQVLMSWGHDEYLYHVLRDHLPLPALYMIRYHSFYPAHRHEAYQHLMNEQDRTMFRHVSEFNPYDLYSKVATPADQKALEPYYRDLLTRHLPAQLRF